jgi:hypothetical protein
MNIETAWTGKSLTVAPGCEDFFDGLRHCSFSLLLQPAKPQGNLVEMLSSGFQALERLLQLAVLECM